jgi:predicted O-methyltransferase YrrM
MLDRNRPYGIVYGNAGHAFEQDGKKFDHHGREILEIVEDPPTRKGKRTKPANIGKSLVSERVLRDMCAIAEQTPSGAFVELGVYRGGSARKLADVAERQGRALHLFDTFTGIPFKGHHDNHAVGDFADTDEDAVRRLIPTAHFHVGVFPDTMPADLGSIAFAHIDADQYQSYKDAIRLFSPLMVEGGVMWFDDVGCLESADKAVQEEFAGRLEQAASGKFYVRF